METNSCNDKLTQRNSLLQPVNSLAGVKYGGKMLQSYKKYNKNWSLGKTSLGHETIELNAQ